jgi:hypothetical protein
MRFIIALVCVALLVGAEAADAAPQQLGNRKLAQFGGGGYRGNRRRDNSDAQFARNQAAAINTQQAIRAAEASGANPWATRGAANVGTANAWLAAQGSDWVFGPNAIIGGKRKA